MSDTDLRQTIARDRVAAARTMDQGATLTAGARLFDVVRGRMLAGIRGQHPDWPAGEVEAEFRRQLALLRLRDERGIGPPAASP